VEEEEEAAGETSGFAMQGLRTKMWRLIELLTLLALLVQMSQY
jgi:hypothetical protein